MHVGVKQLRAVEFHAVWHADVADRSTRSRGVDRLHHRLLRADTLEHRIRADALGQLLDALDAFVAALGHNVGRAKFARQRLPRVVATHRDDPFGTHLFRRQHAEQANSSITHDDDRCTGFTFAASAANHPVPSTSDTARKLGT